MHGAVGKKRQIIETDLGVEKAWSSRGLYAQTDYIRRVVQRARDKKLTGIVGRARLQWDKPFEDSHEVNLYAFSRFMKDPGLAVDAVLSDWVGRRYPSNAVPHLVSALKRSEFIQHHGRWHLEYWVTKGIGDAWDNYPYYFSRVAIRSRYKWTHDPADAALEEKLYHPDAVTFQRLVAEKDDVINQVRAAQNDLRQAGPFLTPEQQAAWERDLDFLMDAARLQREWVRAYFAQRMYLDNHSDETRAVAEEALAALERIERAPGITYGLDPRTGRRYHIDVFVRKMRSRMADPAAAMAEDAQILDRVRRLEQLAGANEH